MSTLIEDGLTMTVIGCGTMGIAILSGILASLSKGRASSIITAPQTPSSTSIASTTAEELPSLLPCRFIACVRRASSARRIESALAHYSAPVTVLENDNLAGAQQADIILLCCKPQMFREVLAQSGIRKALAGKLLISILAGVTESQIAEALYGSPTSADSNIEDRCVIVRAMPNTAAQVCESMTVIGSSTPPLPQNTAALVTWIFSRIGRVVHLPPNLMDASTALCGSGPALIALVLESLADGAVAMGLPRAEAQVMAAQAMRGTSALVLNGEHPAILRDKVSTPGGCTIGGLLVLEEGRVRGTVARSIREATVVASQLGKGIQGVNGTRF